MHTHTFTHNIVDEKEKKEHAGNKYKYKNCFLPKNLLCHLVMRTVPISSVRIGQRLHVHRDTHLTPFPLSAPDPSPHQDAKNKVANFSSLSNEFVLCFSNLAQAETFL